MADSFLIRFMELLIAAGAIYVLAGWLRWRRSRDVAMKWERFTTKVLKIDTDNLDDKEKALLCRYLQAEYEKDPECAKLKEDLRYVKKRFTRLLRDLDDTKEELLVGNQLARYSSNRELRVAGTGTRAAGPITTFGRGRRR